MNSIKNPVEKVMEKLEISWLMASEEAKDIRAFLWRVPAGGKALLDSFIALQQHEKGRSVADLFLGLQTPFDTGYGYSAALGREFVERYEATPDIAALTFDDLLPCHTPGQLQQLLQRFTDQFSAHFRYLILVLQPSLISDEKSLQRWLNSWISQKESPVKLLLIDTVEQQQWQPLCEAHPHAVRLISDDIDNMQVMHQTARRLPDPDSNRQLFRRYLTDIMLLLEKGSAAQVAARGDMALNIARRAGWADQQVMIDNMVGGGWLKGGDYSQSVAHYQQAQTACCDIANITLRKQLLTQSIFGEAGAWFASKNYLQAAQCYRRAADEAQGIPHAVFALEGWRMSGFCLTLAGQREKALAEYAAAIHSARALPVAERSQTTLPQLFQDLLRLHNKRLAGALEACATRWQNEKQRLIGEAEARLSSQPTTDQVRHTDRLLQLQLEAAFLHIREQREKLIGDGDPGFQQVILLAREMLHRQWNGLPDIAHPFDAPPGEWQALPTWGNTGEASTETAENSAL